VTARILITFVCFVCFPLPLPAQTLEQQLLSESAGELAKAARVAGDAKRGAVLFHQVHVGCSKCHAMDGSGNSLGPDLTKLGTQQDATDEYVISALLKPSAQIRKGFEAMTVVTNDGRTRTGLLVSRDDSGVVLRDPAQDGKKVLIPADQIDEAVKSPLSIMPAGIVNQMGGRQQFLDLLRYVMDVRDGGLKVAQRLQPAPSLIAFTVPEYEGHVDHAGLVRKLGDDAFERGQQIYERLCINCHGDKKKPGSLPTALRFAEGKFRHGSDPHTMYKTLTHGFGFMVPQTWMVPQQKYDVIHYIRETYLKEDNASQYVAISDSYLGVLPKGDTFGPEPVEYAPWSDMNYGPSMINTFEVGTDGSNFAHKGIAVRLDSGPGGVSKGNRWAIFDHDTMRLAAAWQREPESNAAGFIDWQGIHFDGRHGKHPRIVGDVLFANPNGPGWAKPGSADFTDDQRVIGRDDNRYGPLPSDWAKYRGLHTIGDQTIIEYTVGGRRILERLGAVEIQSSRHSPSDDVRRLESQTTDSPGSDTRATNERSNADGPDAPASGSVDATALLVTRSDDGYVVVTRTMSIAASESPNIVQVATHPDDKVSFRRIGKYSGILSSGRAAKKVIDASKFNGASYLRIDDGDAFDMTTDDFSITARVRTTNNGTIFSKANANGPWVRDGKAFFVRDGRLTYDIGWVGAAKSKKRIDDSEWHHVAMTWNHSTGRVNFFIDGKMNGNGNLRPKAMVEGHVAKIGYSANDFPNPSFFNGEIEYVVFHQKELTKKEIGAFTVHEQRKIAPVAVWDLKQEPVENVIRGNASPVATSQEPVSVAFDDGVLKFPARVVHGDGYHDNTAIFAGVNGAHAATTLDSEGSRLIAELPSGDELQNIVIWTATVDAEMSIDELKILEERIKDKILPDDLQERIKQSGRARWPEIVATTPVIGDDDGPFAVDVLSPPAGNPWLTRLRFTGHDFFDDGDRAAVCTWDGDAWMVGGLRSMKELKWQRIASGLFQPLGLKIVDGTIYVTCRDQLVILRDRNGDGETDFYQCFNNDHQVTPHFHEFAMGLQRDDAGNFYYAKSARHALKAVVPHHGTLLRIPGDGSRTDIVANGFRAANGVCLNPDGSFIVTDQEGHWNPKNRINWVREGGFYGNMFGYHDITDDSNEAMEQPLCWITNAFDRSPAELMWIKNKAWGPLNGSLLNLSYGYGKVYVVPHENIRGQMQGGMCEFPIPQFPTGIARGRISPHDNGLYLCGMFAWGSSQQAREGGFYRVRPTGKPSYLPVGLNVAGKELKITFTDPLDAVSAATPENYSLKVWSLERTANYGSKHYDEHEIAATAAQVSEDGKSVTLTIPELDRTWCMEIKCRVTSADGEEFERVIHNTIHRVE